MNLKHIARAIILVSLCGACMLALGARSRSTLSNSNIKIADLSWMSGRWQTGPESRAHIEEYWMLPEGGSMIGVSRTVAGGKTVEFEYLRIEQREDGIYYVGSPGGRCPGTDFKLTRLEGKVAIFENPQHDFPKRIIYRRLSDTSLVASIDAGEGTKSKSYPYIRATN
jgi:hypothetical protein